MSPIKIGWIKCKKGTPLVLIFLLEYLWKVRDWKEISIVKIKIYNQLVKNNPFSMGLNSSLKVKKIKLNKIVSRIFQDKWILDIKKKLISVGMQ